MSGTIKKESLIFRSSYNKSYGVNSEFVIIYVTVYLPLFFLSIISSIDTFTDIKIIIKTCIDKTPYIDTIAKKLINIESKKAIPQVCKIDLWVAFLLVQFDKEYNVYIYKIN